MPTAVLLVAGFRMIVAERPLFAIRHHGQAITFNPQIHQIIAHRFGTFFSQYKVISGASTLIAMAFHLDLSVAMRAQPFGVPTQNLSAFLTDRPAVISKEDVAKTG